MQGISDGSVPPWLVPVLIVHLAFFLVLIYPTWRIFLRASVRGAYSLVHLIPILGWIIVAGIMVKTVMKRARRPWPLALLTIVPLVNVLFLWLFAFAQWPSVRSTTKTMQKSVKASTSEVSRDEPTLEPATPELAMPDMGASDIDERTVDPVGLASLAETAGSEAANSAAAKANEITTGPKDGVSPAKPLDEPTLFPDKVSGEKPDGPTREPVAPPPISPKEVTVEPVISASTDVKEVAKEAVDGSSPDPVPADDSSSVDVAAATGAPAETPPPKMAEEKKAAAQPSDGDKIDLSFIEEDAVALAEGVIADLDKAPEDLPADPLADPEKGPVKTPETNPVTNPVTNDEKAADEKPVRSERTVPAAHEQPIGERIWSIRGISARSANIEVVVHEKDLAHSTTGILIGRSNRADFIINDESVSRNHARFLFHENSIQVEDLDSMNGTWVDGEKLEANVPAALGHRSEVEFGKVRLEVTQALPKD